MTATLGNDLMYRPLQHQFAVTIPKNSSNAELIEHCIKEALLAYMGVNTTVSVKQVDVETVEISILQAISFNEAVSVLNTEPEVTRSKAPRARN